MTAEWWQKNSNVYDCPCGRRITSSYNQWANAHGFGRRLFCECGQWFDIRYTARDGWSMRVLHPTSEKVRAAIGKTTTCLVWSVEEEETP